MSDKIKKDIELLDECLEHWESNIKEAEEDGYLDVSAGSCALCNAYQDIYDPGLGYACAGCPIRKKTGKSLCQDTPYYKVLNARHLNFQEETVISKRRLVDSAKEEYELLKTLQQELKNELQQIQKEIVR